MVRINQWLDFFFFFCFSFVEQCEIEIEQHAITAEVKMYRTIPCPMDEYMFSTKFFLFIYFRYDNGPLSPYTD